MALGLPRIGPRSGLIRSISTARAAGRGAPGADKARGWASVRSVEIEVVGPDPLVNSVDDPRATNQDYLDAAPTGIDARYAWTFAGGDGAGQRVVDIERGWTFSHEDLTAHGITLINGAVLDTSRAHGTSVFGEMIASDNAVGCVGIAPNVASALAGRSDRRSGLTNTSDSSQWATRLTRGRLVRGAVAPGAGSRSTC